MADVVLGGENCGIQKKILHTGRGRLPHFNDGAKLAFHYQTRKCDEEHTVLDDTKHSHHCGHDHGHSHTHQHQPKPMELYIGKQFKLEVWEKCLKTMCVGEVASFTCHASLLATYPLVAKSLRDIANGKKGEQPQHCCGLTIQEHGLGYPDLDELLKSPQDLEFILELIKVEEPGEYNKEAWTMDEGEKTEAIPELKEEGNALYKQGKYSQAADKYAQAIGMLESLLLKERPGDEEYKKIDEQKIPFLLNFSQCKLLVDDFYPVIEHTSEVLNKDPDNVKALFRRGKAHVGAWNPELARLDFHRVEELDPSLSKTVQKLLKDLDEKQKHKDADDRSKLEGKMFG